MNARRAGFSLIELVMVVVTVAIAAVAIGSAFAYMARSQSLGQDLQRAWQIAQECAAHIVGAARKPGHFNAVPADTVSFDSTACDVIAQSAPYVRRVSVTDIVSAEVDVPGVAPTLCTGPLVDIDRTWSCKRVRISVDRGGPNLATLNFMLFYY